MALQYDFSRLDRERESTPELLPNVFIRISVDFYRIRGLFLSGMIILHISVASKKKKSDTVEIFFFNQRYCARIYNEVSQQLV